MRGIEDGDSRGNLLRAGGGLLLIGACLYLTLSPSRPPPPEPLRARRTTPSALSHSVRFQLPVRYSDGLAISFGGHTLRQRLLRASDATTSDPGAEQVRYQDVLPGVHARIELSEDGAEEWLRIPSPRAEPLSYEVVLEGPGQLVVTRDRQAALVDAEGRTRAEMRPLVYRDAQGAEKPIGHVALTGEVLRIDLPLPTDPAEYPIEVDPGWFSSAWTARRSLVVDNSANAATLTDFQVRVDNPIRNENGLVGSWHLSEGAGTRISNDGRVHGSDGTLTIGPGGNPSVPAAWVAGMPGNALSFDGVDDAVLGIQNDELPVGAEPVSAFAWIRTSSPARQTAFSYGSSAFGQAVSLNVSQLAPNGNFVVDFYGFLGHDTGIVVNDGAWHFVGFTYAGGTPQITSFVDGVFVDGVLGAIPSIAGGTNAQIGRWVTAGVGDTNPYFFNGAVDEVRVYDRVLAREEIQALYEARPHDGLIDEWAMNEGSGATVFDGTVEGANGVLALGALGNTSVPAARVPGRIGGALRFDGLDDGVTTVDAPRFSPVNNGGELSVAAWVRVLALNTDAHGQNRQPIVAKGNTPEWEWALYTIDTGEVGFSTWQPGGAGHSEIAGGSITLGTWHHVAASFRDGVFNRVYLDGVQVVEGTVFAGAMVDNSRPVVIGMREDGQFLNADIDEVRIYNRALSAAEVRSLARQGPPGDLAEWLRLDEGSGTLVADSSGMDNTGTLDLGTVGNTSVPAAWTAGVLRRAIDFDGADDRVSVPDAPELSPVNAVSVSTWFRIDALKNFNFVLGKGFDASETVELYADAAGSLGGEWLWGDGSRTSFCPKPVVAAGRWYHAVVTYDAGDTRFYLDGVLFSTQANPATLSVNARPLIVGWEENPLGGFMPGRAFDGRIDDLRLYRRALTAEEVSSLYQEGSRGRARLDSADVRFTAADGQTVLPHWRERDGVFWVRVPVVPANGTTTIQCYYGNPSATDASDGPSTFVLFDGFETYAPGSTAVPPYTWFNNGGGGPAFDVFAIGGKWGQVYRQPNTTDSYPGGAFRALAIAEPYAAAVDLQELIDDGTNEPHPGLLYKITDGLNYDGCYFRETSDQIVNFRNRGGARTYDVPTVPQTVIPPRWYKIEAVVLGATADVFVDDAYRMTPVGLLPATTQVGILYHNGGFNDQAHFDNLRVRRFTNPAPTIAPGPPAARPQAPPAGLAQLRMDGITPIPLGGATAGETTVVLRGTVFDVEPLRALRLEVEAKPVGTAFDETGTSLSAPLVFGGQTATETLAGLLPDTPYHWRARCTDEAGLQGPWATFGGNPESSADFVTGSAPAAPGTLAQNRTPGGGGAPIPIGAWTSETSVVLSGMLTDPDAADTLALQVEVSPIATAFTGAVSAQSGFVANGSTASVTVGGLLDTTEHHWRGRTIDDKGVTGPWASFGGNAENPPTVPAARDFGVDTTAPSVPVLATPADGALLATSTPALDWTDSIDATSGVANYDVEVAADAGFTAIQWSATVAASGATTGALPDGTHFWRVRARDNAGNVSAFSGARTFTTDPTAPSVPVLVSPADGAILATSVVTLDWGDSTDGTSGVLNYDVQVASDPGFAAIEWSATVVPSTATAGVLPDGLHFWRVRARDLAGNVSAFSASRSFTTDTVPPSVPVLSSPADGAVLGLPSVALDWLDSTDATSGVMNYDVQVAIDAAFTAIAWSSTVVPSAATTAPLPDELFFWRVRARDLAGNLSAFSAVRQFTVLATPARWQPSALGSDAGGGISNTSAPSIDPCLAVNPVTGQAGVVWTDSDPAARDLETYMRERVGTSFVELGGSASAGGVSNNGTSSQFSAIAYDATGRPVVAWTDAADGDAEIYVRRFDGGAWAELAASATGGGVSANATSSTDPSVAVNPLTQQPGVAWVDAGEVLFREFDGTAWVERAGSGSSRGISVTAGRSVQPSLAYDAAGRAIVAWAEEPNGEVWLRRWNGATWEELGGSASAGGISRTTGASRHPSVVVNAAGQPLVVWEEHLADGNSEIYGRQWTGTTWAEAGAGAAGGGGISRTPGASMEPHAAANAGGTLILAVWTDASDPQGDLEVYGRLLTNGVWREVGASSARAGGISSNASTSTNACCGVGANYAYVSWQDDAAGNWEVYVRRLLLANLADGPGEIVAGPGRGGGGRYRVFDDGSALYAPLELRTLPWAAYDAGVGALHPACGDVDGEGLDEVVLGLGTWPPSGGWSAVIRDHSGRFEVLRWLRLPWSAYNAANGEVFPACGDLDGDGRDELVLGIGTYPQAGGFLAVFDDAAAGYAFLGWVRAGRPAYNSTNGAVHPACGDVDGDGFDELVIGLGVSGEGEATVRDDRRLGFAAIAAIRYPNLAYDAANGTTWPACLDLDGNGLADVVLGPGVGGNGQLYLYADRRGGFSRTGSLAVPWGVYASAVGEARPAGANLDADEAAEVVSGLGPFPQSGGFLYVHDDVSAGGSSRGRWIRYVNGAYDAVNGETWPAVGQIR